MKVVKRSIGEKINTLSCSIAAGTIDLATWGGLMCLYWQWFIIPAFGVPAMPLYLAMIVRIFFGAMVESDLFARRLETPAGDGWALLIRQIIKSLALIISLGGFAAGMHFL